MMQSCEICDIRKGDLIIITHSRDIRNEFVTYDYPVIVLAIAELRLGRGMMCICGSTVKSWVMYEGFDSISLLMSIDDAV